MMRNNFKSKKIPQPLTLFFFVVILFGSTGYALGQTTRYETATEGVKVEKVSETKWNIINKDGEFVGVLESETRQTFKMYYTNGMFVGIILESGAWQPRLYRSRNTIIQPDEARLYLDALDAIELIQ